MSFTHLLIYFLPPILYYFIYLHIFFQPIPVERKSKTLYPLTPKQFSVFPENKIIPLHDHSTTVKIRKFNISTTLS